MTFLELCQRAASESGTISGTYPTAVTAQSGRLLKVVNWVVAAWKEIQNSRNAWLFLRKEFSSGNVTSGTAKYTGASFGLTDHASWITDEGSITIYKTSEGVADEGEIEPITWAEWRARYSRGSQTNNRPLEYAVSPAGELCLGPVPDDAYTIAGEYRRTAQVLAANTDVPIVKDQYHDLIWQKALMLMVEHDEAPLAIGASVKNFNIKMDAFERDYLPVVATAGGEPLA